MRRGKLCNSLFSSLLRSLRELIRPLPSAVEHARINKVLPVNRYTAMYGVGEMSSSRVPVTRPNLPILEISRAVPRFF